MYIYIYIYTHTYVGQMVWMHKGRMFPSFLETANHSMAISGS